MKYNVIIPAAGKATRMRPLSNAVSKALVPVNGRPIISYILDQILKTGEANEIVIVQNELKDIENFVRNAYPQLVEQEKIKFAPQHDPQGPLHAIDCGARKINQGLLPMMVWLGDTICLENKLPLDKSFLVTSPVEDYQRWCLVDEDCVFYDKPDTPPRTNKALIGIYFFHNPQGFWKALDEGMGKPKIKSEYQISSLLESYLQNSHFFYLVVTQEWYDCGELRTYYESKAKLLKNTSRAFNKIEVDTFMGTVKKSSNDAEKSAKIQMEKEWFENIPEEASLFCPRVLTSDEGVLLMSQEPGTPLNETWLYENLRVDIWKTIVDKILRIHNEVFASCAGQAADPEDWKKAMQEMYIDKNLKRLEEYCKDYPEYDYVYDFVKKTGEDLVNTHPSWSSVLHGDSHLGNILFDPLSGSIKLVDPRGKFGHIKGTEGDLRYDMAKMTQDFYMNYADILANNYKIVDDEVVLYRDDAVNVQLINHLRTRLTEYGYDWQLIFRLAIVLIITCIPFHYEDPKRQKAFWLHSLKKIKSLG